MTNLQNNTAPLFPSLCRFAAWIWIIRGVWGIPWYMLSPAAEREKLLVSAVISIAIGVAFIYVGAQTLRGVPRDMLKSGIGSIAYGVYALGALMNIQRQLGSLEGQHGLVFVFQGCMAFSLVLAGGAVLAARQEYRRWRSGGIPEGQ